MGSCGILISQLFKKPFEKSPDMVGLFDPEVSVYLLFPVKSIRIHEVSFKAPCSKNLNEVAELATYARFRAKVL